MKNLYSDPKHILNEMKRMMVEADTIKYKHDGESKEMPADSAKKMPDDHPAKQAWLSKQKGDSDDSGEKVKGADLFKSKEGEPTSKSDNSKSSTTTGSANDAADKAIGNILNNLGAAPLSQLVSQNAAALKAYLNSGDPKAKTFIEDSIVDNNISIDDYKVKVLNQELKANGIKHKVNFKSIQQRTYEPPKVVGKTSTPDSSDSDAKSDITPKGSSSINDNGSLIINVAPNQDEESVIAALKTQLGFDDEEVYDDMNYSYDSESGTITIHSEEMDWDTDDIDYRLDYDGKFDSEDELDPEDILANAKAAYERGLIDKAEWDDKRDEYDDSGDYSDDKITYYWEDEEAKKDHESSVGKKQESVNESFLSSTAKILLSRRIR